MSKRKKIPRQERLKRPKRPNHDLVELKQMLGFGLGIASLLGGIFKSINENKNDENDISDKVTYETEKENTLLIENKINE